MENTFHIPYESSEIGLVKVSLISPKEREVWKAESVHSKCICIPTKREKGENANENENGKGKNKITIKEDPFPLEGVRDQPDPFAAYHAHLGYHPSTATDNERHEWYAFSTLLPPPGLFPKALHPRHKNMGMSNNSVLDFSTDDTDEDERISRTRRIIIDHEESNNEPFPSG